MTHLEEATGFSEPARFVLHPTDFSPDSELAFAHALRLALTNNAHLTLLHVGKGSEEEWDRFPEVRRTLQRWGYLGVDARRTDVVKLGLKIEKLIADRCSIVDALTTYLVERPIDLLVLATEGRRGLAGWLKPSTAERAARETAIPTLFVPGNAHGCVSLETGRVSMDQVLVPVDHQPSSESAIERGLRAIEAYGHAHSRLTLLHVGSDSHFPRLRLPQSVQRVERIVQHGNVVAEILAAADKYRANLLIMATQGSNGFLDVLRGTTTEQVLRQAPCPVLSVPADF